MPLSSGAASTQHSVSQISSWHMQTESLAMSGSSAGKRFFEARDARPQIATERSFLLVETESESKRPRQIAGIRQTTGNLG